MTFERAMLAARSSDVSSIVAGALRAPSRPLPAPVRRFAASRLGHSFEEVRVHADAEAGRSARALGARGYALGGRVVIDPTLDLETAAGVLVHELAHVAQAPRATADLGSAAPLDAAEDDAEREAAAATREVMAGRAAPIRQRGGLVVRRQQIAGPAPAEAPTVSRLEVEEWLLVYRWLSRWEIEPEGERRLIGRLGLNHKENILHIAEAIWERRLRSSGRADPRLLLRRGTPDAARALADGPIRELYERAIRIGEQRLEPHEEELINAAVSTLGTGAVKGLPALTGDSHVDTATLAEAILCNRMALVFSAQVDPLFCIDPRATRDNPIFAAFRATVVAPLYAELRERPGRELVQAMDERRLAAGTHDWQLRQIAETGVVRSHGHTVVPALGLLRTLQALARATQPRARGTPDFAIVSLIRPQQGPHGAGRGPQGAIPPGETGLGRAVDIVRFAGNTIDIAQPQQAVAGVAAVIRALPPGCYILGLPRPPRTDPEGGAEDLQQHLRFYRATTVPPQRPLLSPLGERAVAENPFLPAVNLRRCPTGRLDGDLAALRPGGQAELTAAARTAAANGARIICMFPDGPDHLHVQVERCPAPRQ